MKLAQRKFDRTRGQVRRIQRLARCFLFKKKYLEFKRKNEECASLILNFHRTFQFLKSFG